MNKFAETILHQFPKRKVVIVGDLVADQFLQGTIARVSREAPVFILSHDETETLAGGAANAAVNVAALGGQAVAVGLIGEDPNGGALLEKLRSSGVDCQFAVSSGKVRTTTKIRVLAGHQYALRQQVIRIDYENKASIDRDIREKLKANCIAACRDADAVIISDYSLDPELGVVNDEIAECVMRIAREKQIPLVVDSRFRLANFRGVTSATPNQDEVKEILKKELTTDDCFELLEQLGTESLLVTRGNKGMLLVERNRPPLELEAVGSKEPVDVTGAGDTVIATLAVMLAAGLGLENAVRVANRAAGIVVGKLGTAAATYKELF